MSTPLADRMRRFLRADVQGMHGYAVQPSAGMVKVDTMENPFPLPPALRRALGERLAEVALNRYPAERGDVLRAELARHAQMPAGNDIMLGNGSDELISLLTLACANQLAGGAVNTVLAPLPGFVMYELSAKLQGLRFVGVPTTADFQLDAAGHARGGARAPAGAGLPRLPEQPDRQPLGRRRDRRRHRGRARAWW